MSPEFPPQPPHFLGKTFKIFMVMRISMLKKLKTTVELAPKKIEGLKVISKLHEASGKTFLNISSFMYACVWIAAQFSR